MCHSNLVAASSGLKMVLRSGTLLDRNASNLWVWLTTAVQIAACLCMTSTIPSRLRTSTTGVTSSSSKHPHTTQNAFPLWCWATRSMLMRADGRSVSASVRTCVLLLIYVVGNTEAGFGVVSVKGQYPLFRDFRQGGCQCSRSIRSCREERSATRSRRTIVCFYCLVLQVSS